MFGTIFGLAYSLVQVGMCRLFQFGLREMVLIGLGWLRYDVVVLGLCGLGCIGVVWGGQAGLGWFRLIWVGLGFRLVVV